MIVPLGDFRKIQELTSGSPVSYQNGRVDEKTLNIRIATFSKIYEKIPEGQKNLSA